jgi:DNA-binding NarL/FixJ family response regulator
MVNVIIVDDHELFRLGITTAIAKRYPDIRIVGESETGAGLFNLLKVVTADIILLDIMLPDISGIEIARYLKRERPEIKILAVSADNTTSVVQEMLEIGIEGFISKRAGGVDTLVEAIHSIMSGLEYFGKDISDIIFRVYFAKKKTVEVSSDFTEQEKRIIELCHQGLPGKLVADRLGISTRTVDKHKNNIFRKLGINSTLEMVSYAVKNGIID